MFPFLHSVQKLFQFGVAARHLQTQNSVTGGEDLEMHETRSLYSHRNASTVTKRQCMCECVLAHLFS